MSDPELEAKIGGQGMSKLCSNWQQFYHDIRHLLLNGEPFFLSRIGGSDTSAVIDYLRARDEGELAVETHIRVHIGRVERYNGFYDLQANKKSSYLNYIDTLHRLYLSTQICTFCHPHFLTIYFRDQIHESFCSKYIPNRTALELFVSNLVDRPEFVCGYPYNFIEHFLQNPFTLFRAFSEILQGKKVLVISPFAESIAANFENRHRFFKIEYTYPEFQLSLLNTPITYAGIPVEFYPDANWHATVDRLISEVNVLDFDLALLSCGSYAMPLGQHIFARMNRKAIYVGGVLQLFFGVMGRRYKNIFFEDQINTNYYIEPLEKRNYLSAIPKDDDAAREAFGAYF